MDSPQLDILLHRSEGETLDFKSQQYVFNGATEEQKGELLKDIIALANAWKDSPGYLVIGVEEQNGRATVLTGVTEHLPDHTVQQFVNAKTNRPVRFQVESVLHNGVELDIVCVSTQQARPLFLTKPYGRLQKGIVYLRRGSSTAEADADEIAAMGRSEVLSSAQTIPNIEVEFANPKKRERWGKETSLTTNLLIEPPSRLPHGIVSPLEPKPEEWVAYIKKNARYGSVTFWAQNIGTLNLSNARMEIRIPHREGIAIKSGHERPDKPRLWMEAMMQIYRPPSIEVEDEGGEYVMQLDVGTLQPKSEFWMDGDFLVAVREDCEIPVHIRVFADDLPNPVEKKLILKVGIVERPYTRLDLSTAKEAG